MKSYIIKSYLCFILFALALVSVPLANAGQAPDPELSVARQAFDEARSCVPKPYYLVECQTLPGGAAVAKFFKFNGDQIIAQALQSGSSPREWRVSDSLCVLGDNGIFNSTSQGFHPWKRELLDFCNACVNDPTCLTLVP